MDKLIAIMNKVGIPFAYDHFAEGESPEPPFICYLLPGSDNFAADGRVYYKINDVNIELYTDTKDLSAEQQLEDVLDKYGIIGKTIENGKTVTHYNYTIPMLIFTCLGLLALIFAFMLKAEDKKKGYGLEQPNIKK